ASAPRRTPGCHRPLPLPAAPWSAPRTSSDPRTYRVRGPTPGPSPHLVATPNAPRPRPTPRPPPPPPHPYAAPPAPPPAPPGRCHRGRVRRHRIASRGERGRRDQPGPLEPVRGEHRQRRVGRGQRLIDRPRGGHMGAD